MIHKYSDIRLSGTRKAKARKRQQVEEADAHMDTTCPNHDHGDQAERSTSSCCQTESERSSKWLLTMQDVEQNQSRNGLGQQQTLENKAQFDHWRMSETQTESEYGSAFSSTRMTGLLEVEANESLSHSVSPGTLDADSVMSTPQTTEVNPEDCFNLSGTNTSSECVGSFPTCTANQTEDHCEPSESPTGSIMGGDTPSTSSTSSTTEALLPRLRPTAPIHCVVPNCCDFFTSPHPHYPKEMVGWTKSEESPNSSSVPTDPINPETTSGEVDNEGGEHERSDHSDDSSVTRNSDEFEMWDYVCPQYARRNCANEWF